MKRFNVRAYGLWLNESGEVLVSDEKIKGQRIIEFPGGGLEWGEGLADALKREWQEELSIAVEVGDHFYTTDFFQPSAWDDSQVISVYYKVQPREYIPIPYYNGSEHFYFVPVDAALESLLSLPIDKLVARKLL